MKKLFISFLITFSMIGNLFAQVPATDLILKSSNAKIEEPMVMQHKDVVISIGDLKIKAPFLYQGEVTPKQGYIIDIRDTIRIKDVVEGCQSSCDVLIDEINKSCISKLNLCQENCDKRINIITKENDNLNAKLKELKDNLSSEKTSKYIWTIVGTISGAGLGILVYEISR